MDSSSVILPLFFCEDYQKPLDKNIFFIWLKNLIRKANHVELSRAGAQSSMKDQILDPSFVILPLFCFCFFFLWGLPEDL